MQPRMTEKTALLDELYAAHIVYLNRFMLKLTRNPDEAADLVQDIFVRLCQLDRVPDYPKEWLARTGYWLFIDQWRRKRRYDARLPLFRDAVMVPADPEQAVLDTEFELAFRRLLLRFKPDMRRALYMRFYKQATYAEIALALGVSVNTVKSYIRRSKRQLARWLEPGMTASSAGCD